MRVTIKEVAKLAGVSPSTVTRVVQNKSTISDETKKRVRAAMKELDYHPNLNARSLVSQSTQVIGLVLPDDSDVFYQNPFFPTVLRGISQGRASPAARATRRSSTSAGTTSVSNWATLRLGEGRALRGGDRLQALPILVYA